MGRRMNKRERVQRAKARQAQIARARVDRLIALAETAAVGGRFERARRYAALAQRVNLRHQLRSPPALRHRVCRGCGEFLHPGVTCRVRVREGRVVTTCLTCGRVRRRPLPSRGERGETRPSHERDRRPRAGAPGEHA